MQARWTDWPPGRPRWQQLALAAASSVGRGGCRHCGDRARQALRPGAQPRRPLRLRRPADRRALGALVRAARLGREHARLQLVLPTARAHVHAGGQRELVRARRLPLHRGGRQRPRRPGAAARGRGRAARARVGAPRGARHRAARGTRPRGRARRDREPRRGRARRRPRRDRARPVAPAAGRAGPASAGGRRPSRRDDLHARGVRAERRRPQPLPARARGAAGRRRRAATRSSARRSRRRRSGAATSSRPLSSARSRTTCARRSPGSRPRSGALRNRTLQLSSDDRDELLETIDARVGPPEPPRRGPPRPLARWRRERPRRSARSGRSTTSSARPSTRSTPARGSSSPAASRRS